MPPASGHNHTARVDLRAACHVLAKNIDVIVFAFVHCQDRCIARDTWFQGAKFRPLQGKPRILGRQFDHCRQVDPHAQEL